MAFTSLFCPSLLFLLSFILFAPHLAYSRAVLRKRQDEQDSENNDDPPSPPDEAEEEGAPTESSEAPSSSESSESTSQEQPTDSVDITTSSATEQTSDNAESPSPSPTPTDNASGDGDDFRSDSESSSAQETEAPSSDEEPTSTELDSISSSPSPSSSAVPSTTLEIATSTPVVTETIEFTSGSSSVTGSSANDERVFSTGGNINVPSPSTSSTQSFTLETTLSLQYPPSDAVSSTGEAATATNMSALAQDGFWDNKPAVGGTFAVVGIAAIVVIVFITRIVMRRRRALAERRDDAFIFPGSSHYRDESLGSTHSRMGTPTDYHARNMQQINDANVNYDPTAYYEAESSDHAHSNESFSAFPGFAQARTNVYLPAVQTPSPATAAARPPTAQSHVADPFADPVTAGASTATLESSPFADPPLHPSGSSSQSHLRPQFQGAGAAYPAGRISSLYTSSEVDSFYGDEHGRAM